MSKGDEKKSVWELWYGGNNLTLTVLIIVVALGLSVWEEGAFVPYREVGDGQQDAPLPEPACSPVTACVNLTAVMRSGPIDSALPPAEGEGGEEWHCLTSWWKDIITASPILKKQVSGVGNQCTDCRLLTFKCCLSDSASWQAIYSFCVLIYGMGIRKLSVEKLWKLISWSV